MNKTLGGKSGKLKCSICGKPRYPQVQLCPACYYRESNWSWYGILGTYEVAVRSDGDTEIGVTGLFKTRATSLAHACAKFSSPHLQWIGIVHNHTASSKEEEVDLWLSMVDKSGCGDNKILTA